MKKLKLTKIITSTLIVALVLALNPIGANAEWKQDSKGWWYADENSYAKNQWKQLNGNWYYFNYDGYMEQNRIIDGYYLDSNGAWSTGTKEIQAYEKILTNPRLLKEKYSLSISDYYINKNQPQQAEILDIDKDGIYEAIVQSETCHADAKISVFTYNNGDIKFAGDLSSTSYFYSENQKALLERVEAMVNRLVIGLILSALVIGSSLLVQTSPNGHTFISNLGIFGYSIAALSILFLISESFYRRYRKWKDR